MTGVKPQASTAQKLEPLSTSHTMRAIKSFPFSQVERRRLSRRTLENVKMHEKAGSNVE
jgi:hypothetical protein